MRKLSRFIPIARSEAAAAHTGIGPRSYWLREDQCTQPRNGPAPHRHQTASSERGQRTRQTSGSQRPFQAQCAKPGHCGNWRRTPLKPRAQITHSAAAHVRAILRSCAAATPFHHHHGRQSAIIIAILQTLAPPAWPTMTSLVAIALRPASAILLALQMPLCA